VLNLYTTEARVDTLTGCVSTPSCLQHMLHCILQQCMHF